MKINRSMKKEVLKINEDMQKIMLTVFHYAKEMRTLEIRYS